MNDDRILWKAPEHGYREHSADWYWAAGIITISLAIAFFILGNALLSIIVILGVGTLLVSAKRPMSFVECELSAQGIRTNGTLYPWDTLLSFWVDKSTDKKTGAVTRIILLTSKKPLAPQIIIPLGNDAPMEDIRATLAHMLEEQPQVEPVAHRLMRMLGF